MAGVHRQCIRRAGADLPNRLPQRVDLCHQEIRPAVEQVRSEEECPTRTPIATIIRHDGNIAWRWGEAEGAALFRPTSACKQRIKQLQPTEFEDLFVLGRASCSQKAAASRNSASWLSGIPSSARAASCLKAVKGRSFTFIVTASITRSSLRGPSLARSHFGETTSIPNEPTARGRKRDPGQSEDHPISAEYRSSDRGIQSKILHVLRFLAGQLG
jgi:hypothetical protein